MSIPKDEQGDQTSTFAPMLFQFFINYTENVDGSTSSSIKSEWAINAAAALAQAHSHLGGAKGVVSVDNVEPEPYRAKVDGDDRTLRSLTRIEYAIAMATLAKQSGANTAGDVAQFLRFIEEA